jgi:hypothetical protein
MHARSDAKSTPPKKSRADGMAVAALEPKAEGTMIEAALST